MSYVIVPNKGLLENISLKSGDKLGVGYPKSHIVYRYHLDKDCTVTLSFQYIV